MTELNGIVVRAPVRIVEVEIDDGNETHLVRHGVSAAEVHQVFVHQVFAGNPEIRRNRKGRAGTHVAVGTTGGGRRVLIPFIDHGNGRARPITAWEVGT